MAIRNPGGTQFDVQALLDESVAATGGLSDFGDPTFRPGLDSLCEALDREASLSPAGAAAMRTKVLDHLVNRLWVEQWFTAEPAIAAEELSAPVVIVGLPRTGTTTLHRLLARDHRLQSMKWWESVYPVPFPGEDLADPQLRPARARLDVEFMTTAIPELMAIHPMQADAPDEEVMLMEHSFLSAFNAYADIPSYTAYLSGADQRPAYRYLERMLKFLQWQQRERGVVGQRWLLKSPHHLLRLEVLLEVFPEAQILQTHRDPTITVPSFADFVWVLRKIYSDDPDPRRVGAEWDGLLQQGVDQAMDVRAEHRRQVLDVRFDDIVAHPLDVIHAIYDFIDLPVDEVHEAAVHEQTEPGHGGQRPAHEYAAETFGLTSTQIAADYARYRQFLDEIGQPLQPTRT